MGGGEGGGSNRRRGGRGRGGMIVTDGLVGDREDGTMVSGVVCDVSFSCVVKHKDDGQTKFMKLNSQRQDIIIKYWVSIGSIHREQG